MTNVKVKDSAVRHPNCVPCVITNIKTGTVWFRGSIHESASKLGISPYTMYKYRKLNKPYKGKYIIQRCGFDMTVNFS